MTDDVRQPVRQDYDALVDLEHEAQTRQHAWALIKLTCRLGQAGCVPAAAEPLLEDLRDPDVAPRLPASSDFWPLKERTDVVLQGSAYAPGGAPAHQLEVSVAVGQARKRVAVFGRRAVTWGPDGRPRVEPSEPFVSVPLTWSEAYGGLDWRTPLDDPTDPLAISRLDVDHPGLYPRNPHGKGYLVQPGEVPELLMPRLEDPDDLLDASRLVVGDARAWYRQPLPWCMDWLPAGSFPRTALFATGLEPWYPAPEDSELPEVRRGYLPAGYRAAMEQHNMAQGPPAQFYQGASHGLALPRLTGGEPVVIWGMHPELAEQRFTVPPPPRLELIEAGDRQPAQPRLHHLVCRPAEQIVTLTYAAQRELSRPYIPGVHGEIPLAVSVNGDEPVVYQTPTPVREQLAAARRQARPTRRNRRRDASQSK